MSSNVPPASPHRRRIEQQLRDRYDRERRQGLAAGISLPPVVAQEDRESITATDPAITGGIPCGYEGGFYFDEDGVAVP